MIVVDINSEEVVTVSEPSACAETASVYPQQIAMVTVRIRVLDTPRFFI